jgi:hypothetical protein
VAYKVTAVDTTAEGGSYPPGHLYVVVDFGGGWIEDFIFDLRATDDWLRTVRWTITHHATQGFAGDRRDPNIVLGGPDPHGLKNLCRIFVENGML